MVTDRQVRKLFKMRNKYKHLYQAADAAGMSGKTASKFLKSKQLPSQSRAEHTWQTRRDPFAEDWDWIEQQIQDAEGVLEGKELFELDGKGDDFFRDLRPANVPAIYASVVFLGDQLAIPADHGIRCKEDCGFIEHIPTEPFGFSCHSQPLPIG